MFDRSMLKQNAKIPLKTTYWTAFAVCLVTGVIMGITSGSGAGNSTHGSNNFNFPSLGGVAGDFFANSFVLIIIGVFIGASLIGIAITFFIQNPLSVGQARYFIYNRRYPAEFTTLFSSFKTNYKNIVATMTVQTILIFLWSLLLIIPGIIAMYSYYFVPYILAENPDMPTKRVLELSKIMTAGYKWDLFILGISFLGWILLGLLCCGIGIAFVNPYIASTDAEAYEFLKQTAISRGLCDDSEFGNQR